ncbi:hypothetical protein [Promicromonospora sukumoe]
MIAHRLIRGKLAAEIGKLIVIGATIHVIPKHGVSERQHAQLVGAAESAFFTDRTESLGWGYSIVDGLERWTTWISVPADTISASCLDAMSARPDQLGVTTS